MYKGENRLLCGIPEKVGVGSKWKWDGGWKKNDRMRAYVAGLSICYWRMSEFLPGGF